MYGGVDAYMQCLQLVLFTFVQAIVHFDLQLVISSACAFAAYCLCMCMCASQVGAG